MGYQLELRPGTTIPSPDTLLRGIKELTEENTVYTAASGADYSFNTSEKLNGLLLDRLQQSGQLKAGKYDLDFDHEFIPTEKYDAKYSHKKERGYFSGIATIGEMLVAIENRNANTNVRFHQKETSANIFERLARRGVFIDRCRMDCGSFSEETIRMVHGYCSKFYIRDSRCQTLYERMSEIENWNAVEINFKKYKVASIPFVPFPQEEGYRLVIQRKRRGKEEQGDLFEGEYTYRCIVTNDHESTEKDVVFFITREGPVNVFLTK